MSIRSYELGAKGFPTKIKKSCRPKARGIRLG
jgi:phage FluMu protein Com